MTAAQPAAIRRKVEAWLADDDGTPAIALRAKPEWDGDAVLTIAAVSVRVVPCRTPLAARAALYDRADRERLVLLTELNDAELGDGLLAHLSKQRVRNVDMWDVTANLFEVSEIDPMLARLGRWAAEALIDFAPPGGWPPPPGTVVTRSHALRCLAAEGARLAILLLSAPIFSPGQRKTQPQTNHKPTTKTTSASELVLAELGNLR